MSMIALQIDLNSIEQSKNQSITGSIFFDFGNYQFPEIGWNDFIVVVLSWWLSSMRKLVLDLSKFEELRFMDGPFFLAIKKLGEDKCKIECFEKYEGKAEFSGEFSLKKLNGFILKAAREVEAICTEHHWDTDDISKLRLNIRAVSNSLK